MGPYGNNLALVPPAFHEHLRFVDANTNETDNVWLVTEFSVAFCGTRDGRAPDGRPRNRAMPHMTDVDLEAVVAIDLNITAINTDLETMAAGWGERVAYEAYMFQVDARKISAPAGPGSEFGTSKVDDAVAHIDDILRRLERADGGGAAVQDARAHLTAAKDHLNSVIDARTARARDIERDGPDAPPNLVAKFDILLATEVALENFTPQQQPVTTPQLMREAAACGILPLRMEGAYAGPWYARVGVPSFQMWASTLRSHYIHCGENGSFLAHIDFRFWADRHLGRANIIAIIERHNAFRQWAELKDDDMRSHVVHVLRHEFQQHVELRNGIPVNESMPSAQDILDAVREVDNPTVQAMWNDENFTFQNKVGDDAYLKKIARMVYKEKEHSRVLRPGDRAGRNAQQQRFHAVYGLAIWWATHPCHNAFFGPGQAA